MVKIEEMSKTITFFEQLEREAGPIVLINRITVQTRGGRSTDSCMDNRHRNHEGTTRFYFGTASPGNWGEQRIPQSFCVGISGGFKTGI